MNDKLVKTVVVSGGNGKMGNLVTDYIESRDDFKVVGIFDPTYTEGEYPKINNLEDVDSDIVIEFSPASEINNNLEKLRKINSNLIIGSSGITESVITSLIKFENRTIFVIPNFSVGAALQKITSNIIARSFENVEIVEKHHSGKQDAPSGTAIDLALSLPNNLKSTGIEGDFYSKNNINDKMIMSLRDDIFMAEQEVLFSNEFEHLNSEHIINDRRAYLFGVKLLLDNIDNFQGFVYGLETILNKNISI